MKIQTEAKALIISQAVNQITGENPIVNKYADYVEIKFTPNQQIKLRAFLADQLKPRPPGDVRIDVAPVVLPLAIEKGLPYVLGIAALGFLAGRLTR